MILKNLKENLIQENIKIKEISKNYIQYIQYLNQSKKSSSKNFYIILKYENKEKINYEESAIEDLNQKYFKIKELLSRCGNLISDINNKKEIKKILFSFLNSRIYLNNN